jgi:hypothetical protein
MLTSEWGENMNSSLFTNCKLKEIFMSVVVSVRALGS